ACRVARPGVDRIPEARVDAHGAARRGAAQRHVPARVARVRAPLVVPAPAAGGFLPDHRERVGQGPRLVLARLGVHDGTSRSGGRFRDGRGRHGARLPLESRSDGAAGDARAALRRRLGRDARPAGRDVEPGEPLHGTPPDHSAGRRRCGRSEGHVSGRRSLEQRVAALTTRPRRIALLTSSRFWRGSSSVFAALARGLAARGHATTALVAYEPLATGFATQGVSVRTLPVAHTSLTAARAVRRTQRELRSDIILVDMARDVRHAAAASLGRSLAVVYCISTPEPPRDLFTRIAFGRVRVTVFLTEEHARHTLAAAPFLQRAQQRIIPNGVDGSLFHPDEAAGRAFRERYDLPGGPLLVGVGALAPEKRWDLLLEAVALVAPPTPPLVLCGSGALEGALRAQARRARPARGARGGRAAACGGAVFARTDGAGVRRPARIPRMRSNGPSGRPLRIALLSSSRFWRGANNVFAVLARGLAKRGHTTTAVVAYDAVAAGFRERHLAVRTLPVGHTTLRGARALRRGLRELAADIVLVDRARDIRLAALAALRTPLAVVYCI